MLEATCYDPRVRSVIVGLILSALFPVLVAGQEDVISQARADASSGNRAAGIALLAKHLETTPNDIDARLVYGLILSWDGRYDEARQALRAVLTASPGYLDARVALMNVEWWSGHLTEARELVRSVLSRDAGNAQARHVQQRLDARMRPWSIGIGGTRDTFNDQRESWQEASLSIGRETPIGALIVRGNRTERFGLRDRQVDVEFYPAFRPGSYAFVGYSAGADDVLYPKRRISLELYQGIGHGVELSGGYRQLDFSSTTRIYLGTLTKYAGNWMLTGKVFVVPGTGVGDSWSYHAVVRRYFGAAGTSFVGGGYSHGFSREEPRGTGDLAHVSADTVRGQADIDLSNLFRVSIAGSSSRQQRAVLMPLWQNTVTAGLIVRF